MTKIQTTIRNGLPVYASGNVGRADENVERPG